MSWHVISDVYKAKLGSPTRKAIAAKLADWADDDGGKIFPSVKRIAEETETSERTVQYVLRAFVKEGLLTVENAGGMGPGSTRRYRINLKHLAALPRTRAPEAPKGATVAPLTQTSRVQGTAKKGAPVAPNPSSQSPRPESDPASIFVEGAGERLIPFEGTDGVSLIAAARAAAEEAAAKMSLGVNRERLPFTADALFKIGRLYVDRQALIERYNEKTKGKKIKDPSAYLLRMAQDEVAKRDGVPVAVVAQMASRDQETRAKAMAAAVGARTEETEEDAKRKRRMNAPRTNGAALMAALKARAR